MAHWWVSMFDTAEISGVNRQTDLLYCTVVDADTLKEAASCAMALVTNPPAVGFASVVEIPEPHWANFAPYLNRMIPRGELQNIKLEGLTSCPAQWTES
jgi:hypothetical protein